MIFKQCTKCGYHWQSRDQWLRDPSVTLVGYQVNFKRLETGILLFNHTCRTTLALPVLVFEDLYDGPVFVERAAGSEACPGHCLHESNLKPCPERCECAYVRYILHLIQQWPKQTDAA
ncbi:MAG: hypothetical protein VR64_21400 [Desulfatitalea sp. BRH_c12]|nr:MAG: hypothetical protein VR64_21400 [Desulfatitalea sp. BRH_c12]